MSDSAPCTQQAIQSYQDAGYLVQRAVFSPEEISAFRLESERLWADTRLMDEHNLRASVRANTSGRTRVDRLDPIIDLSPLFASLVNDERIHAPLRAIFDEPALLMKDKLIFKAPGAHGYAPHQDYTGWVELPAPPEAIVSVLIALDASNGDNGAVEFYPGLHGKYYLEKCTPTGVLDPSSGLLPADVLAGREAQLIELQPGDMILFSSLAPHRSSPNTTGSYRRHVFLTYSSARYGNLYEEYYANYRRYLSADRAAENLAGQYYL